jgi:peptide/nickel transport system substrate-binding protein
MTSERTRRGFLTAAGTGVAAALAGCSANEPGGTPTDAPTDAPTEADSGGDETEAPTDTATATPEEEQEYTGGTLRLASPGPIQTLDPVNAKGSGAGYNQYQESLMTFPNGDLPPVGELAEDYEVSNGGRTYTFKLREGVQFHDGQELTASDFVYSWERLAGAEETRNADDIVGSTFTIAHEGNTDDSVTNYVPGSLAVEAASDYEFRFTLETAFHGAVSQIAGGAFGVIPENSVAYPKDYESHDLDGLMYEGEYDYNEFFSTAGDGPQFVATGPFRVDSWSKGDQLRLTRFEEYRGEGPYIDAITYTVIGEANTRYQRFLNDNLDVFLEGFPSAKFSQSQLNIERNRGTYRTGTFELENGRTVNYGDATLLDTDYILFNCQRTPLPVRKAFAYALNQEEIANQIYKGLPKPAYHLTPPPAFMKQGDEDPVENYDRHAREGHRSQLDLAADGYPYGMGETRLEDAKAVMEEAGYGPDNRYSVEFTVFSGNSAWDRIAKRLRDKVQVAYIDVDITKADFGTIISKAIDGSLDMFSLGDGMEWPESDNFLRFLHPYEDPSFMFTRWTFEDQSQWTDLMRTADEAWFDTYVPNKGPGEQNQLKRNEAYYVLEEVNWGSVQELPTTHTVRQRLWSQDVDVRMAGSMENQTFDRVTIDRDS